MLSQGRERWSFVKQSMMLPAELGLGAMKIGDGTSGGRRLDHMAERKCSIPEHSDQSSTLRCQILTVLIQMFMMPQRTERG